MTLATEQSSLLTSSSPIKPINNNQVPWRPPLCSNDKLWAAKLMYAIYAAGQSAVLNFMPVYYEHTAHFSKMEIGWLQTLSCICSIVSPPFWGVVADHLHSHRAVHIFTIVTGTFLMYGIQWGTTSFSITTAIVIAANFQTAPAGSLLDHAVLDMIAKYGGEYGKQRLFGAVGYGAGAYVTGLIVMMGGISWAFRISLCLSLASLFVLRQIPALEEHDTKGTGGGLERTPSFYQGMRQLIKQRDVIVLLLVVFLMGLMFGVLSSFLTLHLYNLSNQNAQIIGVAIMCETLSELPAFFYSQRILKYMGTVKVLILSIIGYALRISYYAVMVNPWTAIAFEFLHGITFGLAWAACTQYIYASAPRGCQGTVMGILNAVQNGLGKGAGTLIGGYCYQHYGPHIMWVVTDMGVPLALLGVVAFAKLQHPKIKVLDEIHVDLIVEEEMVETAELFSPHCATPQPLTTPLWQEVHDHPVHENPV